MKFFPDSTTVVALGPLEIKWYAVFILGGAFVTYMIVKRNLKKKHYPHHIAEDLFVGALLSGIVGARLWYIAFSNPAAYLTDPMRILNFQEGGLAIHGGLIFGILYAWFYLKKQRYHFIEVADEIMYTILIAQAVGRWGNFINKEAFGPVVDQSAIAWLPQFIQEGMFVNGAYHMPTFLYESIANLIGFLLIHFVLRKVASLKRGDLSYTYLMWYGVVRFFIEIFRTDALLVGNGELKIAQITSIVFILIGMAGYLGLFRKLFPLEKPVLIFDFDGTLMDTHQVIIETFKQVLKDETLKTEMNEKDYDSLVGPTLEESFTRFVENPDLNQLLSKYEKNMIINHKDMADQMPGSIELLQQLKADNYKIGIFSNKKTNMIKMGMDQVNMTPYIDEVVGKDKVEQAKPNPEGIFLLLKELDGYRDNVVMVGDSEADILAGQNASAYTILYSDNPLRKEQLLQLKPNASVDNLLEIKTHLRKEGLWNQYTN